MHNLQGHRRSLTWVASLAAAVALATYGAGAVLAEDPACTGANGQPVTQADAAADPTLCGAAPTPPAPEPEPPVAEPVPPVAEPVPPVAEPEPPVVEPVPPVTQPAPPVVAPAPEATTATPAPPTSITPVPAVAEPTPVTPPASPVTKIDTTAPATTTPAKPTTTRPIRTTPSPTTVPPRPVPPTVTAPRPTVPTVTAPRPAAPRPTTPVRVVKPTAPATRTHTLLRAKQFRAAPFRDARLFRERFTPKGRIPEQPNLSQQQADMLFDAATGTGTHWSTLAAIAWMDSRWGDPSAGSLLGRRLTDAAWSAYGRDGDGDGAVERSSVADQARTVATYLAGARSGKGAALRAYFGGHNQLALTRRAGFLADYFDALGPEAIVTGLEDPATRKAIEERILADKDVEIYDGGRADIQAGLIDPRVLVSIEFLAKRFDTITISSLISGHGVYTAGGNVSLHSFGQAVDIAALGGESIVGHQAKGGRTYRALKELLLLPDAMQAAELISLWDLGLPSFALSDHQDHIHMGFKTVGDDEADDAAASLGD